MIEDSHCLTASQAYGCVVAANISNGKNTGFAGLGCLTSARGTPEESRLYPRIKVPGDDCIHATIDLAKLRWKRKHLRTMHQRRPDMYHLLTQDVTMWQNYPEIPWDCPECAELVNRAQLFLYIDKEYSNEQKIMVDSWYRNDSGQSNSHRPILIDAVFEGAVIYLVDSWGMGTSSRQMGHSPIFPAFRLWVETVWPQSQRKRITSVSTIFGPEGVNVFGSCSAGLVGAAAGTWTTC